MRFIFILLICVLPMTIHGQYTYFNLDIAPENPESGGGISINLLIRNDTLVTYGASTDGVEGVQRTHHIINSDGILLEIRNFEYPADLVFYAEYAEAMIKVTDGYISSGAFADLTYPKIQGRVYKLNDEFEEQWVYIEDQYQVDTSYATDYPIVRHLLDGNYITAGTAALDTNGTFDFGGEFDDIILTKLSSDGQFIWHKELNFTNDLLFQLNQPFVRICDLFELSNGDLLLLGAWYPTYQPFALRLSPEGNFIDHISWGNSTQNDWLPWAVQIAPDTFMFAYQHATGTAPQGEDFVHHKPRVGILNASSITVSDFTMYEHEHFWGNLTDFEQTPDGGFVILGYGGDDGGEFYGEAYMLKIDAAGNELWYNTYLPPIDYHTPEVWDLEITSDGGLAFVGNFGVLGQNYYNSWVVKTDACGDELFNGCPVGISELQISNSKFQIAPNPANNVVNISSTQEFESITIRDITGRIVYKEQMSNHTLNKSLSVKEFGVAGLYLVEVDFGGGRVGAQKLVVE